MNASFNCFDHYFKHIQAQAMQNVSLFIGLDERQYDHYVHKKMNLNPVKLIKICISYMGEQLIITLFRGTHACQYTFMSIHDHS